MAGDSVRQNDRSTASWRRCMLTTMLAALVGTACGSSPVEPTARRPPTPVGPVALPAIDGLVREVNGPPLAGASIRVTSIGETAFFVSDAAGRFAVPHGAGMPGWPRTLHVSLGSWGDQYYSGDAVLVPGGDAGPVSVVLRLQRVVRLTETSPLAAALTDDALSFSQSGAFECVRCLAVGLPRANLSDAPGFDLRVHQDQPAALRVLLVGTMDYEDVVLAGNAGDERSTSVGLRLSRALLNSSQYNPTLYIEKVAGPASVGLAIELIPVREQEES